MKNSLKIPGTSFVAVTTKLFEKCFDVALNHGDTEKGMQIINTVILSCEVNINKFAIITRMILIILLRFMTEYSRIYRFKH